MRKLYYQLVDVFTHQAFGGNPLAVFTNGRDLSAALMQQLAKELNLSETTFVLPPKDPQNDFWVRIFTPAVEMPMAGHPTVGTAFVLAQERLIEAAEDESVVRFEEGVGVIPVTLKWVDGRPAMIKMGQPLPQFGPEFPDRAAIAAMVGLDLADLDPQAPLEAVSCGVPFLFVPLKNLEAIRRASLRQELWQKTLKDFAAPHVFVFTMETESEGSTVHSRMFAPALGIPEDPATGAASGPLGCYLVKHQFVARQARVSILSEQGFEIGRPSFIHVEIEQQAGQITGVSVGGQCVAMGQGYIQI